MASSEGCCILCGGASKGMGLFCERYKEGLGCAPKLLPEATRRKWQLPRKEKAGK